MNFKDWVETVPEGIKNDALWKMTVYKQALFFGDIAWLDVGKLAKDKKTLALSDQLYRAAGSISANIAEGYSRASKKDQARFYEYSLGSARECRGWYYQARYVLGENVSNHRIQFLEEIIKQLMVIVPAQRGKKIREDSSGYETDLEGLLSDVPVPGE